MGADKDFSAEDPKDIGLDGVMDELKNMLSSLNEEHPIPDAPSAPESNGKIPHDNAVEVDREAIENYLSDVPGFPAFSDPDPDPEPVPEPKAKPKSVVQPDEILTPPSPPVSESAPEPFGEPVEEPSEEQPHTNALEGDKDFWSGNVLGWPTEKPAVEPVKPLDEPHEPTPEDWLKSQSKETAEKISRHIIDPQKKKKPDPEPAPEPITEPPIEPDPEEMPIPKQEDVPDPAPKEPFISPFVTSSNEDPLLQPDFNPEVPEGTEAVDPEQTVILPATPVAPKSDLTAEIPAISEIDALPPDGPTSESEIPPFPAAPVPIPGTIEKETKPAKAEEIEFDGEDILPKPSGLVQIAVFYPEGQEKAGQHFVSNLKRACGMSTHEINVQAVLIQGWVEGQIDLKAWAQAAQLSGADMVYAMGLKKDRDQLQMMPRVAEDQNLKGRLIVIEQVGLRALYADVLTELRRIV